ncbi:hypothetical protein MTO96_035245 [Rhipicephalus appendiculatus]
MVVGGHIPTSLLVDTGATASLMSKKDFDMLFASKHRLLQASIYLQNFSKHRIPVLGYFRTHLQHHRKRAYVIFYVTAHGTSLLGLDTIQQLGLLIDDATPTDDDDPKESVTPNAEADQYVTRSDVLVHMDKVRTYIGRCSDVPD